MAFFDLLLLGSCRTMVCRNTPHLDEFRDRKENTILIGYARVLKAQRRAARAGQKKT